MPRPVVGDVDAAVVLAQDPYGVAVDTRFGVPAGADYLDITASPVARRASAIGERALLPVQAKSTRGRTGRSVLVAEGFGGQRVHRSRRLRR